MNQSNDGGVLKMALNPSGGTAPYAPSQAVIKVIDRYREAGFAGQPVNEVTLQKLQVTDSLIPRTLASLRLLDLIDEDGKPTDQFDVLKNAPSSEFMARLGEWLKDTYAPIFGFCDPTTATAERVEDAFRGYVPDGQRSRMANLFLGLAQYAGFIHEIPTKPRGRHAAKTNGHAGKMKGQAKPTAGGRKGGGSSGAATPLPPVNPDLSTYRQRYVDLLIAKAESQESPDSELLDRIERALGIATSEPGSRP